VNTQTNTYTEQQKKYPKIRQIRLIETEHGRYVATNKFMHGLEEAIDIGTTNVNIA